MAKETNSTSAMTAADRPKTPIRALKKTPPRSVTTPPVARFMGLGVALTRAYDTRASARSWSGSPLVLKTEP
jgi:hypothetical protein